MANKREIKEYRIWKAMKARCYAPSNRTNHNKHYSLNGINVCKKWLNDYESFIKDMGPIPSNDHTIERIDNNGDYSPSNCKWIHKSQQSKNRGSFNIIIRHNGEEKILKDWDRYFGIRYGTLYKRIFKQNVWN